MLIVTVHACMCLVGNRYTHTCACMCFQYTPCMCTTNKDLVVSRSIMYSMPQQIDGNYLYWIYFYAVYVFPPQLNTLVVVVVVSIAIRQRGYIYSNCCRELKFFASK